MALIKAAHSHRGTALIDVISPCVTFNNQDNSHHSYAWGKLHEVALHELSFVPPAEDILVDYEGGEAVEVTMHDGSHLILRKLDVDYDPTDRSGTLCMLEDANRKNELITGLIYIDTDKPPLLERYNLTNVPLNRLTEDNLRPSRDTIDELNAMMF